jgi:hypothetical protein
LSDPVIRGSAVRKPATTNTPMIVARIYPRRSGSATQTPLEKRAVNLDAPEYLILPKPKVTAVQVGTHKVGLA